LDVGGPFSAYLSRRDSERFAFVLLAADTCGGDDSPLMQKGSPIGKRYVSTVAP
jgi:hypothetical protein